MHLMMHLELQSPVSFTTIYIYIFYIVTVHLSCTRVALNVLPAAFNVDGVDGGNAKRFKVFRA